MYYKTLIIIGLIFGLLVNLSFAMGRAPITPEANGRAPSTPEASARAINFKLEDLNGKSHTLSDYKGKTVLLIFFATWCPHCRAEMPSLQKLYKSWDNKKFVLLAVSLGESKEKVKDFADKNGYTFPILLDTDKKVGKNYKVRGIPVAFLIDEKGNVITKEVGKREWTIELIQDLIK
jgi:peroxiredoxin